MKSLAYLNKYLWRYKWQLLLGFLFVCLSNVFAIWQPRVIREALDSVLLMLKSHNLSDKISDELFHFGIIVLALSIGMGFFMFMMRQMIIVTSRKIEYDLREDIYEHYQSLDMTFYKSYHTGDLMSRITEDISKVRQYLGPAILYGINMFSLFVLVIWSMISVDPVLTVLSLSPLPILSYSIFVVSKRINKQSTTIQKQLASINSSAQEAYSGVRVVKSYVQEEKFTKHFESQSETYKNLNMKLVGVNAYFFPLMVLIIGISILITVYVGGIRVIDGKITPGNIAEFVIYVSMLTWPVTSIGWIASIVQQAAASQTRINEIMNYKPGIINGNFKEEEINGDITFSNVSFTYPNTGIQALKQVSFSIRKGEKVAIVGKTGSGKTTISDLLLRLYDPQSGNIRIDDVDITSWNLTALRERIGYVTQDAFLFSDTVKENIAFGRRDSDMSDIELYARHAAVWEEIQGLPQQHETVVGERGVTLSGGQKQRIAIARALIKNPDIVILDDSLSAVDADTESQIAGYLNGELADKTAIIITHRLHTRMEYDRILVLDEGRLAEEGTHQQLMNSGGIYARLYERQAMAEAN